MHSLRSLKWTTNAAAADLITWGIPSELAGGAALPRPGMPGAGAKKLAKMRHLYMMVTNYLSTTTRP
jgi:hypothetical protein